MLREHALFDALVMPDAIGLLFSRYDAPIGSYGRHVDSAFMRYSASGRTRRDVSFTIMLSSHSEYEGGVLTIGDDEMQRYKLAQGAAIVYPATSLHEVTPVTSGSRLVIVGWARSYIRDAAQRELLFELEVAKASLFDKLGKTTEIDLLSKCAANLTRMWIED
jgi:PKHD-type hydroxylase